MNNKIFTKGFITVFTTLWFSIAWTSVSFSQPVLKPVAPVDGISVPNNTPLLSWTGVPCSFYEVWLDGRMIDSVGADFHASVPFPLSFGEHSWYIVAVNGNKRITSKEAAFTVDDRPLENIPEGSSLLRYGWKIQSSLLTKDGGAKLSGPNADLQQWYTSSVPVTVLSALVRNGVYPNPYKDMNNMKIPDSHDEYNKEYDLLKYSHIKGQNPWKDPYWYVNHFEVPPGYKGKHIWLNFSEINYRAEVWLNGIQIADTIRMTGMERSFRFDVTSLVKHKKTNYLAVAVYPVDIPGKPSIEPITPLGSPGENMGDGLISKNYTKWDALGWDWQPAIRDREMGITEDVYLSATGSLEVDNLYITSDLPLPDTSSASLIISGDILNYSGKEQKGVIEATISFERTAISVKQRFHTAAGKKYSFLWDKNTFPQLNIAHPRLWWPHGYGKPNLYKLKISVIRGKDTAAISEMNFGIREVETYIGKKERVYKINGREIYCKGGNWVMDMMLNWNAQRYEDEIVLTRNANLNMLRVWGPTGVPPAVFYDAADQNGILIWQDFLYDFWGTFKNRPGYNTNNDLYERITTGIVKKYRNHPSLVIWCGGNEGPNPREALIIKKILPENDGRDSKHYLKISNGDGLHGGGPYHTLPPADYFTHGSLNGFSSEIGPSGVPVMESMRKFMAVPGKNTLTDRFPINSSWAYHDANDWAGSDLRKFSSYDNIIMQQYQRPATTSKIGAGEYIEKAQLLNYDVYRSAIESINRQLWSNASGILLWKSNSSWPSMVWQIYDWYLQAHAGYYGTKTAAEPFHIQLNRDSLDIIVMNSLHRGFPDAGISARLYNTAGEIVWTRYSRTNILENTIYRTGWITPVDSTIKFLRLELADAAGTIHSSNTYWLNRQNDYSALKSMAPADISGKIFKIEEKLKTEFTLLLTNNGNHIAFMIECRLQGSETGMELLPSFWSKNYITLLPHETIELKVSINNHDITESPVVSCKAFNMLEPLIVR